MFRQFTLLTVFLWSPRLDAADRTRPDDATQPALEETVRVLSAECQTILQNTAIPSISIALFQDDQIIWAEAFGVSNVKRKVPASPETIYCTASCWKPVNAMAVMRLSDAGLVKLDDPINDYLGELTIRGASADAPVTVRHLLAHYSGLPTGAEIVPLWERRLPKSLEELAEDLVLESPPGKEYRYSNIGYAVAGLLIERVSGRTYEEYIVENILKPVGVELTGPVNPTPEMVEELALPYRLEGNRAVPETQYRFDVYPAGEAYLSVPDMSRVLLTHLNGGRYGEVTILSEAAIEEMRTRQFGGSDGLDFGIRESDGKTLIMHGGGVAGYSTKFLLDVDSKVGVYVAANAGGVNQTTNMLAQLAIDLLLGREIGTGLVRRFVGIGIGLAVDEESGEVRISHVNPTAPAGPAGLTPGLVIEKINGDSVAGNSIAECIEMMHGPAGTTVRLQLYDPVPMKRTTVELTKRPFLVAS